ncbi:MAG: (2Fe-2S) ferredoxin domain-containing protein [Bradymonadaceae bacterium]
MKSVDTKGCLAHVLVCTNLRDHGGMPSCARGDSEEVYARLRRWIAKNSMLARIWVTPTGCLGWCHIDGATVAIYPEGIWYRAVTPEDVDEFIARHLQPLLSPCP